ncbi:MAG: PHB depolymerase family esterase [Chitinispirillaceae bacterium]|nr:PHB depolymerase family esterase [Chitinispirillaceae bacterium]
MNFDKRFLRIMWNSIIFCVFLIISQLLSASLTEVPRNNWAGSVSLPSYVKMYIYVPDKVATNPPIVVSIHACQSSVTGQLDNNKKIKAAADKNGFIIIFPDNPGRNCWDVGSKKALTHDGGGDPHAIAQMVRYALKQYKGDSTRVYAVGGSSGGMMVQALMGVYPELFTAGVPRAGVPCGCWSESYDESQQWSGPCAGGSVSKTAQQWGDLVRAINPNYTGHRPRLQIFHGESDQTINFKNFNESIKQWTNVLGLKTDPDSNAKISPPAAGYTYNQKFWKNKCGYIVLEAWSAPGQPHSMTYEEDAILKFFGLDVAGDKDPELSACGGTFLQGRRNGRINPVLEGANVTETTIYTLNGRIIQSFSSSIKEKNSLSRIKSGAVYIAERKLNDGKVEIVPIIKQ